jgi:RNA recognition motif-containing protein
MTELFVSNLHYDLSEAECRSLFEAFGPVFKARLVRDVHTGKSRGFAFICMHDEDAERAICAIDGTRVRDRWVFVKVNTAKEAGS